MTSRLVVDSCVAYKWLEPQGEDGIAEASALLDAAEQGDLLLAAPTLLRVEIANIIRYTGLDADDAADLLYEFDDFHIDLYETDIGGAEDALRLAVRHGLSLYDALFLQLAAALECPLVTADRRAFAGLTGCGVEIRLL